MIYLHLMRVYGVYKPTYGVPLQHTSASALLVYTETFPTDLDVWVGNEHGYPV
jgi:hypothetical protein